MCTSFLVFMCTLTQLSFHVYGVNEGICKISTCKSQKPEMLKELCSEESMIVDGRCCILSNHSAGEAVVGIDLSDCELTSLLAFEKEVALNGTTYRKENITFIGAYNNPIETCTAELDGMNNLQTVWWPDNCTCPGGNSSWEHVSHHYPKKIDDTYCHIQKDPCKEKDVVCPSQSQCVWYAPGKAMCDCDNSWHGYKCLRREKFPMVIFLAGVGCGFAVLSGLLWFLFRRKVKKID